MQGWTRWPPTWARRRWLWGPVCLLTLLVGVGAGVVTARLTGRPAPAVAARTPATAFPGLVPSPEGSSPSASSWWKPLPTATGPFVPARIVIEKLHVQAPVEVKGLDANNAMEAPDRGTDAAWYRFSTQPGAGGNAVFSGYRDFGQVGSAAIFWDLDRLTAGDLVEVVSDRLTEVRYRVSWSSTYSLADMPMAQVLASDPVDEVTLIAPAGAFVRGGYDHRLVVRAIRAL